MGMNRVKGDRYAPVRVTSSLLISPYNDLYEVNATLGTPVTLTTPPAHGQDPTVGPNFCTPGDRWKVFDLGNNATAQAITIAAGAGMAFFGGGGTAQITQNGGAVELTILDDGVTIQVDNFAAGVGPVTTSTWTDVAAGTAFAPTAAQSYLSCDSTGAVQTTIALLAAPSNGQVQVIRLTGAGKVMPVIVNAQGAGITVESAVTPGTFGASTYLAIADMVASYKFDGATSQWKLYSLTQGSAQATAQTTWNVSYATGSASGDGVTIPVNSFAEIYRRWQGGVLGTVPALPAGTITVNVVDGTAGFSDPASVLFNITGAGVKIVLQSTSTTLVHSGTLATASAFARTSAAGQILITDAGVADWHAFAPLPLLFVDTTATSVGVLYEPFSGSNASGTITPNRAPQVAGTASFGLVKMVSGGDSYQLLRPLSIYMGTGSVPRTFPVGDDGAVGVNIFVYRLHLTTQSEFETMALCKAPDAGIDTSVTLQECIFDPLTDITGMTVVNCWSANGIGFEQVNNVNGCELFAGGTYGGLFLQNAGVIINGDFVFDPAAGGLSETIANARGCQVNVRVGTMSFWGAAGSMVLATSGYFEFRIGGPLVDPVAIAYGKVGGANPVYQMGPENYLAFTAGGVSSNNFDSSTFELSSNLSGYAFNPVTGVYVGPTTFTFPHLDAAIGAGTGFGNFAIEARTNTIATTYSG